LVALEEFLRAAPGSARALQIEGAAGMGKTALWLAGVARARELHTRVLVARPASEEAGFGFAGLGDLLDGLTLEGLTGPMRAALEGALLLREADPGADARAVSAAVLALLREAAVGGTTIVAIDDVPWLDLPSASALAYSARRLAGHDVRFLCAARSPRPGTGVLQRALESRRIGLGPLSLGAIGRLVHERLGAQLSRVAIRRIYEASGGNPLFALELGREIAASGGLLGRDVPLPSRLEELLEDRVTELGPAAREALFAVALSPDPRAAELTAVVGEDALEDAVAAGVVSLDGWRVRPAHPLLGEVVKSRSRATVRREMHRRLAAAAEDVERRALHLALAASGPDGAVAAEVSGAAARAERRGAHANAAELAELALELTPEGDPDRPERMLAAGRCNVAVGRTGRADELLALEQLPAGTMRTEAMLLLADLDTISAADALRRLEQAANEAPDGSDLRAQALSRLAFFFAVSLVERLEEAEALAADAVRVAVATPNAAALGEARGTLAWVRAMRGLPNEDADIASGPDCQAPGLRSMWRSIGVQQMWRGEVADARRTLDLARARADQRGELEAHMALRLQLCELELRRGGFDVVEELLDEWEREHVEWAASDIALARCRALLAVGRGDPVAAESAAVDALDRAQRRSEGRWQELEALRAQGMASLLVGDGAAAVRSLGKVWKHKLSEGIDEPGVFPVAPELAAALSMTGDLDQARTVVDRLAAQSERQSHPWGGAAAARARGHLLLAERDDEGAAQAFAEAAARFESLDMPFPSGRAQLWLGVALRRARRLRDARETLERAAAQFDELGSPGWAERARDELRRIGGRRAPGTGLTPTERRIAELVARGLANKRIASELVVTVGTVEAHLTRIYAKVGVRSRTELAAWLAGGDERSI
jgi:DNA-binding CsgD family transcriptional regulator